jgi:hypothetical protein
MKRFSAAGWRELPQRPSKRRSHFAVWGFIPRFEVLLVPELHQSYEWASFRETGDLTHLAKSLKIEAIRDCR